MKLYICIYNEEKHIIEGAEEYPLETEDENYWAKINADRVALQAHLYRPEVWTFYASETGPFEWPEEIEE